MRSGCHFPGSQGKTNCIFARGVADVVLGLDGTGPGGLEGDMSAWEMKVIAAEAQRLLALAAEDAGLRAELRALAEDILRATEGSLPLPTTTGSPGLSPATTSAVPPAVEPLRELTFGRSRSVTARDSLRRRRRRPNLSLRTIDLAEIMSRCRLNAEGARRAAARQRRIREGERLEAETVRR